MFKKRHKKTPVETYYCPTDVINHICCRLDGPAPKTFSSWPDQIVL